MSRQAARVFWEYARPLILGLDDEHRASPPLETALLTNNGLEDVKFAQQWIQNPA